MEVTPTTPYIGIVFSLMGLLFFVGNVSVVRWETHQFHFFPGDLFSEADAVDNF